MSSSGRAKAGSVQASTIRTIIEMFDREPLRTTGIAVSEFSPTPSRTSIPIPLSESLLIFGSASLVLCKDLNTWFCAAAAALAAAPLVVLSGTCGGSTPIPGIGSISGLPWSGGLLDVVPEVF